MSYRVLVIEDSTADARLIRLGVARCPGCSASFAEDGEVALAKLRRVPPWQAEERPNLILLDLNLPKMSGLEFLRALEHDEALRGIPVVVFSGSPSHYDKHQARAARARDYVVKPVSLEPFVEAVANVLTTWMRSGGSELPLDLSAQPEAGDTLPNA